MNTDSRRRGASTELVVTARELNAGAGVGRLGSRVRALGDVMRVLLVVLLVGIAKCSDFSPVGTLSTIVADL